MVIADSFLVIVHGAGELDEDQLSFWTEVPALASCMSEGPSIEAALDNTRSSISDSLARNGRTITDVTLDVELAL